MAVLSQEESHKKTPKFKYFEFYINYWDYYDSPPVAMKK